MPKLQAQCLYERMDDITTLPWTAILIFAFVSACALLVVFAGWKTLRSQREQHEPVAAFTPTQSTFVSAASGLDSETAKRFLAAMKEVHAKDL